MPTVEPNLFTISPLRRLSPSDITSPYNSASRSKKASFVAVISRDSRARVKRFRATVKELGTIALDLEKSSDSVLIGQYAGLTHNEEPAFRSVLTKAPNPLSDEALVGWINQASRRLGIIAAKESATMVDEMLEWIDFEWSTASGETWAAARAGIEGVFRTPSAGMILAQRIETSRILEGVLGKTTGAAVRLPGVSGNIGAGFRLPNKEISQAMMRHHGFFVRNEYGKMAPGLASQVQPIIQRGLEQGMGRKEIARVLQQQIKGGLQMKGYWETVAANAISRSRSYSLASSFTAAGITHYRIEAIVDEATTETCLMLHDMLLPVGPGLANLNRIIAPTSTPEDTMRYQPFIGLEGNEFRANYPDGTHAVVGTRQGDGSYSRASAQQMAGAGVGFPPYHHRCRTTVVPEIV